jgi:hypothetical protein
LYKINNPPRKILTLKAKIILAIFPKAGYKITMIWKNTVKERTLNYLEQLMSDVFRAVEKGNAYAIGHFEQDGEEISPYRLFDTMRYKACIYLREKGYNLKDLSLYGIHINCKGYEIKVLKYQNNGLPPICGKSANRWKFYNHKFNRKLPGIDEFYDVIKELGLEERRELLVLYKVGKDGNFLGLELACTEKAEHKFAPPLLDWKIPVPHSAKTSSNTNKYEEQAKDVTNFETEDDTADELDIFHDGRND